MNKMTAVIFNHAHPKNVLSIFINLYQHAENQEISLICFRDIVD